MDTICIGNDHGGYELKARILDHVAESAAMPDGNAHMSAHDSFASSGPIQGRAGKWTRPLRKTLLPIRPLLSSLHCAGPARASAFPYVCQTGEVHRFGTNLCARQPANSAV